MSRKDVLMLLEMLFAAYPYVKISNPERTAKVWEEVLKDYDEKEISLSAKFHIENNKFFPTPAELIEHLPRVRIIYSEPKSETMINAGGVEKGDDPVLKVALSLFSDNNNKEV